MWIPTPIYARIPQIWFLLGLLFIADGLYLGLEFTVSFAYLLIGAVCCVYGIGIGITRMRYRHSQPAADSISTDNHSATVVPPDPY